MLILLNTIHTALLTFERLKNQKTYNGENKKFNSHNANSANILNDDIP